MTESLDALKAEVRSLLAQDLMLPIPAAEIRDDLPLFGPGGLGLDSVDALQLVVALDKRYGLKIPDPDAAKRVLATVVSIAESVRTQRLKASDQNP